MPSPEVLLTGVLAFAWVWRMCSSVFSSYSIAETITPKSFGTLKAFVVGFQVLTAVILDLVPLSHFPRISLAHRLLSIPSQMYTMYYANKYLGPALDSRRVTIIVAIISILCVLETVYMIKLDWSRIE